MAKIVIFGSGGRAGAAAVQEALSRGHEVTALTRPTGDATDPDAVASAARGHDAAIAAVYDGGRDPAAFFPAAAAGLAEGLARARVPRLVWVGLASLLPDADGVRLMDTEGYPQQFRSFYLAHAAALDVLGASDLDWTAVSPSGDFHHGGAPVGGYRVAPADAASRITYADHAIALVDEAERPHARRAHLGVAASPPRLHVSTSGPDR
jgi:putative NADH-flavin reductase